MAVLIDTNFLLAIILRKDTNHAKAVQAATALGSLRCIVPAPVLHELFQITVARIITQVYTFDQRDFRIFRPAHCPHLELLP
jgi:hypothetical protein